jgi:predicted dehydrogenase
VHFEAIAASPRAVCTALWSRSESTVKKLLEDNKSPADVQTYFGDEGLKALLASDQVDAVVVALPISTVPDYVIKALSAGKHVISEKPVGKDVKTAQALIQRYETDFAHKGLQWRVAESQYNIHSQACTDRSDWAHEPFIVKAQDLIASGQLGRVLYWSLNFQTYRNEEGIPGEWRRVPDYQGGEADVCWRLLS